MTPAFLTRIQSHLTTGNAKDYAGSDLAKEDWAELGRAIEASTRAALTSDVAQAPATIANDGDWRDIDSIIRMLAYADAANRQRAASLLAKMRAVIAAPVAPTPETVTPHPAFITAQHTADFQRLYAVLEDGEGYDIPKPRMESLADIGLIRKVRGSVYEFTQFGLAMQDTLLAATAQSDAEKA